MNYESGMLLAFKWDSESFGLCKVVNVTQTKKEPIINIVTYSNAYNKLPVDLNVEELKPMIIHMPMLESAMQKSEVSEIGKTEVSSEEQTGYENWLELWKERRVGFFDKSIPESIDFIIESMAQVDSPSENNQYRDRLTKHWQSQHQPPR